MQQLTEDAAHRAAGHDDRALGAERATRPMLIALEIGLRTARRGSMRLPRRRMVSMASGMPWPRMRSEPKRAIMPDDEPAGDRHQHAQHAQRAGRAGRDRR